MIVKNEAASINATLASMRADLDYWTIVDTGSTDGTQVHVAASRQRLMCMCTAHAPLRPLLFGSVLLGTHTLSLTFGKVIFTKSYLGMPFDSCLPCLAKTLSHTRLSPSSSASISSCLLLSNHRR